MAVRLEVEPLPADTKEQAEEVPAPRGGFRRFGLGVVRLSRRSDDGRTLFARENTNPLMLIDDHFALRHICRA